MTTAAHNALIVLAAALLVVGLTGPRFLVRLL